MLTNGDHKDAKKVITNKMNMPFSPTIDTKTWKNMM